MQLSLVSMITLTLISSLSVISFAAENKAFLYPRGAGGTRGEQGGTHGEQGLYFEMLQRLDLWSREAQT